MSNILENKPAPVVVLKSHRDRLLNARNPERPMIEQGEADGTYGVSTQGEDCVISLGPIPSFRIPQSVAIKMALLILRRCGVEVSYGEQAVKDDAEVDQQQPSG